MPELEKIVLNGTEYRINSQVDSALSDTSTNPVQNRVVKVAIDALDSRIEALEAGSSEGGGLTDLQKTLIITLFQNAVYTSDQTNNIESLYNSFINHVVEVTGISLNESSVTITDTYILVATLSPRGATGVIEWTSSDTSIATVSQTGVVTPVANGTTTITATCEGYSASCDVTVDTSSAVDIEQNGSTLIIRAVPNVSQNGSTLVFA